MHNLCHDSLDLAAKAFFGMRSAEIAEKQKALQNSSPAEVLSPEEYAPAEIGEIHHTFHAHTTPET